MLADTYHESFIYEIRWGEDEKAPISNHDMERAGQREFKIN